jgi:hypothetical protein
VPIIFRVKKQQNQASPELDSKNDTKRDTPEADLWGFEPKHSSSQSIVKQGKKGRKMTQCLS